MESLEYKTLEKIPVRRPVDRIGFIVESCRGKSVLDIGCLDETAASKRDTEYWLHGRIAAAAREVVGIDNSKAMLGPEMRTAPNSIVYAGDACDTRVLEARGEGASMIVAGEFIEHLESPVGFLRTLRETLPGRELIVSTPNGMSAANALMALIGREAQHPDHLQVFSYKTLNTLFVRAGFKSFEIIPYKFIATELKLESRGLLKGAAIVSEHAIRVIEYVFPLLSFGYIVRART